MRVFEHCEAFKYGMWRANTRYLQWKYSKYSCPSSQYLQYLQYLHDQKY